MLDTKEQLKEWNRVVAMCRGTKFEGEEYLCVKRRIHSGYVCYENGRQMNIELNIDRIFAIAIVDNTPIWLEEPFTLYQREDIRFISMKFTYSSSTHKLIGSGMARTKEGVPLSSMKVAIPIDKVVWNTFTLTKPDTVKQPHINTDSITKGGPSTDIKQVGGTHYKDKAIQPWAYMEANFTKEEFVGFLRGNALKYLDRYKDKNGVEDLRKAIHYIEKLIQVESK